MCSHGRSVTQQLSTKGLPTSCLHIIKLSSSYNNHHRILLYVHRSKIQKICAPVDYGNNNWLIYLILIYNN